MARALAEPQEKDAPGNGMTPSFPGSAWERTYARLRLAEPGENEFAKQEPGTQRTSTDREARESGAGRE